VYIVKYFILFYFINLLFIFNILLFIHALSTISLLEHNNTKVKYEVRLAYPVMRCLKYKNFFNKC
jgi:hypothetical protein